MGHAQLTDKDREDHLRRLAFHLFVSRYTPLIPIVSDRPRPPQLLVGQIPKHLASDLPLPPDSEVLGALVANSSSSVVVLDSALSPEDVLAFYRDRLTATGWNIPSSETPPSGGFTSPPPRDSIRVLFCRGADNTALWIAARILSSQSTGQSTDVRLEWQTPAPGTQDPRQAPCASRQRQWQDPSYLRDLLPPLLPPPDALFLAGWGGTNTGPGYVNAYGTLETDVSIISIADYYAQQLEQGGWSRHDAGQDGWTWPHEGGSSAYNVKRSRARCTGPWDGWCHGSAWHRSTRVAIDAVWLRSRRRIGRDGPRNTQTCQGEAQRRIEVTIPAGKRG